MSKKISGIIGIILSVLILVFFEGYFYKFFSDIGINIYNLDRVVQLIINLIVKFIECFLIYIIFKKDLRNRHRDFSLVKNIFVFIISLICLIFVMFLFNKYVVPFIADIFGVKVITNDFYNIFNKNISLELVLKIISDYIFEPYLYCSVIILSADKLCRRNDIYIVLSGIIALLINALIIKGTVGSAIINSMSSFLLFSILAFIRKKENTIWFSIILYSLYLICNVIIMNYFGWYL